MSGKRRRASGLIPVAPILRAAEREAFAADRISEVVRGVLDASLRDILAEAGAHGYIAYAVNLRPATEDEIAEQVMAAPEAAEGA